MDAPSKSLTSTEIGLKIAQPFYRFDTSLGLMTKKVHAAHILVGKEKKAEKVLGFLKEGKSFAEMARKYSDCPSRKNGGDLGWFGKGQMVSEFEKAAFEAEKGSVVGPVKTQFGYHVIKIIDKK